MNRKEARDFLSRAYHIDKRIDTKIEQIMELNDLATKTSSAMTGMPRNPSPSASQMADTVCKIIDLQTELRRDMDSLLAVKKEVMDVIKGVEDIDSQIILEKRYLCNASWEDIAASLQYGVRWVQTIHNRALDYVIDVLES